MVTVDQMLNTLEEDAKKLIAEMSIDLMNAYATIKEGCIYLNEHGGWSDYLRDVQRKVQDVGMRVSFRKWLLSNRKIINQLFEKYNIEYTLNICTDYGNIYCVVKSKDVADQLCSELLLLTPFVIDRPYYYWEAYTRTSYGIIKIAVHIEDNQNYIDGLSESRPRSEPTEPNEPAEPSVPF